MRLSDLQNKDVVDIASGDRIGSVIDAEISKETGNIMKLIIYDKKSPYSALILFVYSSTFFISERKNEPTI